MGDQLEKLNALTKAAHGPAAEARCAFKLDPTTDQPVECKHTFVVILVDEQGEHELVARASYDAVVNQLLRKLASQETP